MDTNLFFTFVWIALLLLLGIPLLASRWAPTTGVARFYRKSTDVRAVKLQQKKWYAVWGTWVIQASMLLLGIVTNDTLFIVVLVLYIMANVVQNADAVAINRAIANGTAVPR